MELGYLYIWASSLQVSDQLIIISTIYILLYSSEIIGLNNQLIKPILIYSIITLLFMSKGAMHINYKATAVIVLIIYCIHRIYNNDFDSTTHDHKYVSTLFSFV
jgi:uncharacterized membrane protein YvlD (DUF360 family)